MASTDDNDSTVTIGFENCEQLTFRQVDINVMMNGITDSLRSGMFQLPETYMEASYVCLFIPKSAKPCRGDLFGGTKPLTKERLDTYRDISIIMLHGEVFSSAYNDKSIYVDYCDDDKGNNTKHHDFSDERGLTIVIGSDENGSSCNQSRDMIS